jgi:hypothetical protein
MINFSFLDDSDLEGTSPSTSKLNTSGASSGGGSKKEQRHFWMYNVQAKGPKGQKITFETRIEDPHVLSDIVDPVFSGEVQLQGIKHRYLNHFKHRYPKLHSDLDCRIVSKKDFKTSFLGQKYLIA